MKMKRYVVNVREIALQPREKQRDFTNLEISTSISTRLEYHCTCMYFRQTVGKSTTGQYYDNCRKSLQGIEVVFIYLYDCIIWYFVKGNWSKTVILYILVIPVKEVCLVVPVIEGSRQSSIIVCHQTKID